MFYGVAYVDVFFVVYPWQLFFFLIVFVIVYYKVSACP